MSTKLNISIDQGSTINVSFIVNYANGTAQNLSTYTARSMFRRSYTSSNSYSFTCNAYANGLVVLAMNATTSANVPAGRYFYDVELVDGSLNVSRIREGILTVTPEVTR